MCALAEVVGEGSDAQRRQKAPLLQLLLVPARARPDRWQAAVTMLTNSRQTWLPAQWWLWRDGCKQREKRPSVEGVLAGC